MSLDDVDHYPTEEASVMGEDENIDDSYEWEDDNKSEDENFEDNLDEEIDNSDAIVNEMRVTDSTNLSDGLMHSLGSIDMKHVSDNQTWIQALSEINQLMESNPRDFSFVQIIRTSQSLRQFADLQTWPTKTSVWCWWCKHPFEGLPIPLPVRYDVKKDIFYCKGVFCGFSCAAAYLVDASMLHVMSLLNMLRIRLWKCLDIDVQPFSSIVPSAHWTTLDVFGGVDTIEKFRFHNQCMQSFQESMVNVKTTEQKLDVTDWARKIAPCLRSSYNSRVVSFPKCAQASPAFRELMIRQGCIWDANYVMPSPLGMHTMTIPRGVSEPAFMSLAATPSNAPSKRQTKPRQMKRKDKPTNTPFSFVQPPAQTGLLCHPRARKL